MKRVHKRIRSIKRWLQKRRLAIAASTLLLCVGLIGYSSYMHNRRLTVNPATYTPLLSLIGHAEGNNNYNAYFGNSNNTSINFTAMSIDQVLQWQNDYVRQGSPSNAVGKYQIISTTLSGLVQQLNVDTKQKFNPAMQDKFAIALLERRGAESYVNKELTRDQFAANLAKEWAALPKVIGDNPGDSYYAGDGLNKSRVSINEIKKAIDPIGPK